MVRVRILLRSVEASGDVRPVAVPLGVPRAIRREPHVIGLLPIRGGNYADAALVAGGIAAVRIERPAGLGLIESAVRIVAHHGMARLAAHAICFHLGLCHRMGHPCLERGRPLFRDSEVEVRVLAAVEGFLRDAVSLMLRLSH